MTRKELHAIVKGLAPVLRDHVATVRAIERGKDGAPGPAGADGKAGRDGQPGLQGRDGARGEPGRNGIDGLGIEDLQVEFDGERRFTFRFINGDRVKTFGPFSVPAVIYRGVWEEGRAYERGDQVTWAGSQWTAKDATVERPDERGEGARAWTLSVKRGREGKQGPDGKMGPQGPRGEKGEQGPRW